MITYFFFPIGLDLFDKTRKKDFFIRLKVSYMMYYNRKRLILYCVCLINSEPQGIALWQKYSVKKETKHYVKQSPIHNLKILDTYMHFIEYTHISLDKCKEKAQKTCSKNFHSPLILQMQGPPSLYHHNCSMALTHDTRHNKLNNLGKCDF